MPDSVVTRFAPSPTGHLHIGGARTALFCWAYARRHRGKFLLRIEDTDQARSSESSARGILDDLAWLGIEWDEGPEYTTSDGRAIGGDPRGVGPFYQARRLGLYNTIIEKLVVTGHAYPAFETPEELDVKRKASVANKKTYRYDRAALSIPLGERLGRMKDAERSGTPFVIRLQMPDEAITVHDEVLGDVTYPAEELDDFVLRKADGFPTYHFAVVVDDAGMGVTHIMRGQEHLANTPRHIALQRALGYPTPSVAHLPLIFNMDSSKMSKRDKDKAAREACKKAAITASPVSSIDAGAFSAWLGDSKSQLPADQLSRLADAIKVTLPEIEVHDFRAAGYEPQAICNFISLLGWNPGLKYAQGKDLEKFDMEFLASHFETGRVGRTNSKFDRVKLMSFNADCIASMTPEQVAASFLAWCAEFDKPLLELVPRAALVRAVAELRARSKTFRMLAASVRSVWVRAVPTAEQVAKSLDAAIGGGSASGRELVGRLGRALASSPRSDDRTTLSSAIATVAAAASIEPSHLAPAVRMAVCGSTSSPGFDSLFAILGQEEIAKRLLNPP